MMIFNYNSRRKLTIGVTLFVLIVLLIPQVVSAYSVFQVNYNSKNDYSSGHKTGRIYYRDDDKINLTQGNTETTYHYMYVAATGVDAVYKIDTTNGKIVGKYWTCSHTDSSVCSPSRTAVDSNGNVWVGNRGFSGMGGWIEIAGSQNNCFDSNGDGRIETSTNSGALDWGDDECVIRYDNAENHVGIVRAVALDKNGNPWFGYYNLSKFEIRNANTNDESLIKTVNVSPNKPYGAVMDKNGNMWDSGLHSKSVAFVNTTNYKVTVIPLDSESYGITTSGNYVWLPSYSSPYYLYKINVTNQKIVNKYNLGRVGRGITADRDGNIWIANSNQNSVQKFYPKTGDHINIPLSQYGISYPIGAITDSRGEVWVLGHYDGTCTANVCRGKCINYQGGHNCYYKSGDYSIRINPTTDKVDLVVRLPSGSDVYTYSDATGSILNSVIHKGTWFVSINMSKLFPYFDNVNNVEAMVTWNESNVTKGGSIIFSEKQTSENGPKNQNNGEIFEINKSLGNFITLYFKLTGNDDGSSPLLWNITFSVFTSCNTNQDCINQVNGNDCINATCNAGRCDFKLIKDNDSDKYLACNDCSQINSWLANNNFLGCHDCNDNNASIHPGATEICDKTDDNCDNVIDNGMGNLTHFYFDNDSDGYGNMLDNVTMCLNKSTPFAVPFGKSLSSKISASKKETSSSDSPGSLPYYNISKNHKNYVTPITHSGKNYYDCNDSDMYIHPFAKDVCDGYVDNCSKSNAWSFNSNTKKYVYYGGLHTDNDEDKYIACDHCMSLSSFWNINNGMINCSDCDDNNASIHPGVVEYNNRTLLRNRVDDNCNGKVDYGLPPYSVKVRYYNTSSREWVSDDSGNGDWRKDSNPYREQNTLSTLKVNVSVYNKYNSGNLIPIRGIDVLVYAVPKDDSYERISNFFSGNHLTYFNASGKSFQDVSLNLSRYWNYVLNVTYTMPDGNVLYREKVISINQLRQKMNFKIIKDIDCQSCGVTSYSQDGMTECGCYDRNDGCNGTVMTYYSHNCMGHHNNEKIRLSENECPSGDKYKNGCIITCCVGGMSDIAPAPPSVSIRGINVPKNYTEVYQIEKILGTLGQNLWIKLIMIGNHK